MQRGFTLWALVGLLAIGLAGCTLVTGGVRGSGEVVSEPREVGEFDAVRLASVGELRITQGEAAALTVEADDNLLPLITTEVRNGTLVIGTRPNQSIRPSTGPIYTLTVTTLEEVDISGSGNVLSEPLNSAGLTLNISGSGSIQLDGAAVNEMEIGVSGSGNVTIADLVTEALAVDISGSGNVELTGETSSQTVNIGGSGAYRTAALSSQTATVAVGGSGDATLRVAETLDASVGGSGNVRYRGNPRVERSVSGSGSVEQVGE